MERMNRSERRNTTVAREFSWEISASSDDGQRQMAASLKSQNTAGRREGLVRYDVRGGESGILEGAVGTRYVRV